MAFVLGVLGQLIAAVPGKISRSADETVVGRTSKWALAFAANALERP